jgi:hypothetical protein
MAGHKPASPEIQVSLCALQTLMCNEPPGNLLKKQILIQSGVCAFLTSSKVNAGPASNDAAKTQHSSQAPNMPAQLGTSSQLSVK